MEETVISMEQAKNLNEVANLFCPIRNNTTFGQGFAYFKQSGSKFLLLSSTTSAFIAMGDSKRF
jgi:hypothetical protein